MEKIQSASDFFKNISGFFKNDTKKSNTNNNDINGIEEIDFGSDSIDNGDIGFADSNVDNSQTNEIDRAIEEFNVELNEVNNKINRGTLVTKDGVGKMSTVELKELKARQKELLSNISSLRQLKNLLFTTELDQYKSLDNYESISASLNKIKSYSRELAPGVSGDYGVYNYTFYDINGNELKDLSSLEIALYLYQNNIIDVKMSNNNLEINNYLDQFKNLTSDDIKMLNYLSNIGETDKFVDFFKYASDVGNQRKGMELAQETIGKINGYYDKVGTQYYNYRDELVTYTKNDAYLDTVKLLTGTGFIDGLGNFEAGIKDFFGGDGIVSEEQYKTMLVLQMVQEKFSESEFQSLFATSSYEISSSIGNMAPTIAISAIPVVGQGIGLSLMGISSAGNSREQGLQQGMNQKSAMLYGILNGLSEVGLEYVLGGLKGLSSGKAAVTLSERTILPHFLSEMISEGTEESLQSVLEPLFATIATGGEVPYEVDWGEVLKSGIYGMITAGILNGTGEVANITIDGVNYQLATYNIQSIIEMFEGKDLTNQEIKTELINEIEKEQAKKIIEDLNNNKRILRDLSKDEIELLLEINDSSMSQEFTKILKTISDANVTSLERQVLGKIRPNMSKMEIVRLLYYELGKKVDYSELYKAGTKYSSEIQESIYNNNMTYEQLLKNNSIICVHWSQLFAQTLIDAGFPPESIVIQRAVYDEGAKNYRDGYVDGSHSAIYIMMDDGGILCADLTAPIGKYPDYYNVKMGYQTEGFIYFSPEQITQIASSGSGDSTLQRIISDISAYDEAVNSQFHVIQENYSEELYNGLTKEQQDFFSIIAKFMYAAETAGDERIKLKERTKLETEFFNYIKNSNIDILNETDKLIIKYLHDKSEFIKSIDAEYDNDEVMIKEIRDFVQSCIKQGKVNEDFLDANLLNNNNMITIFSYLQDRLRQIGMLIEKKAPIPSIGEGIQFGAFQFYTDGSSAVLPMILYSDGKITGEYYVTIKDGHVSYEPATKLYKSIIKQLGDKKLPVDQRIILEKITPNMDKDTIQSIINKLYSDKVINNEYIVSLDNEEISLILSE